MYTYIICIHTHILYFIDYVVILVWIPPEQTLRQGLALSKLSTYKITSGSRSEGRRNSQYKSVLLGYHLVKLGPDAHPASLSICHAPHRCPLWFEWWSSYLKCCGLSLEAFVSLCFGAAHMCLPSWLLPVSRCRISATESERWVEIEAWSKALSGGSESNPTWNCLPYGKNQRWGPELCTGTLATSGAVAYVLNILVFVGFISLELRCVLKSPVINLCIFSFVSFRQWFMKSVAMLLDEQILTSIIALL